MNLLTFLGTFIAAWRDYPAESGTVLNGRYVVREVIGEGSYGITYKCIDQTTGRVVAVKQARPSKGNIARRLLERESAILQTLIHPRFPAFIDDFKDLRNRTTYLVMTYLDGNTFEELIFERGKVYSEQECIIITLQLLELVQYIHEKGFVHLDLRIPNVLTQGGTLFLIDFGLARQIGDHPSQADFAPPGRRWFRLRQTPPPPLKQATVQADLLDIGHFMLFLLYSAFEPIQLNESGNIDLKETCWQDELAISPELKTIIERLFELQTRYPDVPSLMNDLRRLLPLHGPNNAG